MVDQGPKRQRPPDPTVRRTLQTVATLFLLGGIAAGCALALLTPVPKGFAIALPAICMLTAVNLYYLSSMPKGWHSRRSVEMFNRVYRPLKPLSPSADQSNTDAKTPGTADASKLRTDLDNLKSRL
jgi:hypothetical protein